MQECIWLLAGIVGSGIYFLFFRCKHKWEELKHYTTQSQAQHIGELTNKIPSPNNEYQLAKMTARKTITILTCKHCGKINKTIIDV